jgi:hypothetical protein
MKPKTAHSVITTTRCCHRSPSGRQCRLLASDTRSGLCSEHCAEQQQSDYANVYAPLIRNSPGLQTAQGINFSLSNLYELLAKDRISPRRAAVLAYINSLLLRTLPAIDNDQEAGITDPTAPPDSALDDTGEFIESLTETMRKTGHEKKIVNTTALPSGTSKVAWDPPLPEPDPTKKPS